MTKYGFPRAMQLGYGAGCSYHMLCVLFFHFPVACGGARAKGHITCGKGVGKQNIVFVTITSLRGKGKNCPILKTLASSLSTHCDLGAIHKGRPQNLTVF